MNKYALISECGKYRYTLSRIWDDSKEKVVFICLNPSTADAEKDDPTVRSCIRLAKDWGFGGMIIGNLFAYRATDPKEIRKVNDPIGDENNHWLKWMFFNGFTTVFAWGNGAIGFEARIEEVETMFRRLEDDVPYCMGLNKTKCPVHPLYQKTGVELNEY